MNKIRYCEECTEPIKWNDKIIRLENGDLYHEDCCSIFPYEFVVMVGDDYKGNTENEAEVACAILDDDEYIDMGEESE